MARMKVVDLAPGATRDLLHLKTSCEAGKVKLWAQSDILEDFFSGLSKGESTTLPRMKLKVYLPWSQQVRSTIFSFHDGDNLMDQGVTPRGLWLASVGLAKGIEIKFSSPVPTSVQTLQAFESAVERGLAELWDTLLKPIKSGLRISVHRPLKVDEDDWEGG